MKHTRLAVGILLGAALILPTSLGISLNGVPFNQKPELGFIIFITFLAFRWLAKKLMGAESETVNNTRIWEFLGLVCLGFIGLKLFFPLANGAKICAESPDLAEKGCLFIRENVVSKVADGAEGKPWTLGFQNTLAYNFRECSATDSKCLERTRWKANGALPFSVTYQIPTSWLSSAKEIEIRYTGIVQVQFEGNVATGEFSENPARLKVKIPENLGAMSIRYANYLPSRDPLPLTKASIKIDDWGVSQNRAVILLGQFISSLLLLFVVLIFISEFLPILLGGIPYLSFPQLKAQDLLPFGLFILAFFTSLQSELLSGFYGFYVWVCLFAGGSVWLVPAMRGTNEREARFLCEFLFSLPAVIVASYLFYSLPSFDEFVYLRSGDDWLTYSSFGYELLSHPQWFVHPHFVFTKPFYIYFRAWTLSLLGEGTLYSEFFLRMGFLFLLPLTLPGIKWISSSLDAKRQSLLAMLVGLVVTWSLKNFTVPYSFLVLNTSMAEIPAWLFGALATIALFYSVVRPLNHSSLWLAAGFTVLSGCFRLQSLAVLIIPWAMVYVSGEAPRKVVLKYAIFSLVMVGILVALHASPLLKNNWGEFVSYLGWTTQVKSENLWRDTADRFWHHVLFYMPEAKLILGCFLALGIALTWKIKKNFVIFLIALILAFLSHALIKDPAYYPRHYVFLVQSVLILLPLLAALVLRRSA